MSQIGRISGPLLFSNLERNGVDLAFRNNLDTTELLFLDVDNNRIGVNNDNPLTPLHVAGLLQTSKLLASNSTFGNISLKDNVLSSDVGDINLSAAQAVDIPQIDTDDIRLDTNNITTTRSNSDLDFAPASGAAVSVLKDLRTIGNIHTSGNITLEGSITFGDNQSQDTVTFESELDSDLIPDEDAGSLGNANKRWRDLYTRLVNGQTVTTTNITVEDIDYTLRQGNAFFVDIKGNDANTGDHPQEPFRTLKRALQAADASIQGPVAIMIAPGEFEEDLPLEIPNNVTVTGYDIRNTIIKPAPGFEINDVFLLDGSTTVQNLTVSEFYSDTTERYAFKFKPNAVISGRSPYIQNVTVLTYGSNRTATDSRGFASGDAGSGALVDGAEVHSNSISASMLFQSVTFLTPNANGLVITNGARVEWLSSFTYFADKGLYAFNGSTGRISEDGSTVNFGAELRSIGSANVYGNQAAVADGDDCLFYLINHNFAYVGTGRRADNDNTLAIQENEITELNGGKIVFTSIDQKGNYKVGDNFFVDFDLGTTSIDASQINADTFSRLVIDSRNSETIIDSEQVRTGLIRFADNNLVSLSGDVNLAPENELNVNSNANLKNNLSITGNFGFDGALNLLGNEESDTVKFNVDIDQDFLPDQDSKFDLGSSQKEWNQVWLSEASIDSISINDNYIETTESNADLEFRANGSGRVISRNSIKIDNNLSVTGITSLQEANFKNLILEKSLASTGDNSITGDVLVNQNIVVDSYADFENISILGNAIITRDSNSNLELRANSNGEIVFPNNTINIRTNLASDTVTSFNNIEIELNTESPVFSVSDILFNTNYIETDNIDLEFTANGTSYVSLEEINFVDNVLGTETQDVVLSLNQDLEIQSTGSIQIPVGDTDYVGPTGSIRFDSTDQVFEGFNSATVTFGGVFSDDRETSVAINSAVPQIDFIADAESTGNIDIQGFTFFNLDVDNVNFNDNFISTIQADTDLILDRNGTGEIEISDTKISNNTVKNLRSNGFLTFSNTGLGYTKISSANGVVLPVYNGGNENPFQPLGNVRYNAQDGLMEVFDGVDYVSAAGESAFISEQDYNELVELYTLVLG